MAPSQPPSLSFNRLSFWSVVRQRLVVYGQRAFANPQWLVMAILGRWVVVRQWVHWLGQSSEAMIEGGHQEASLFTALDVETVLTQLKADGVCRGVDLPATAVAQILRAIPAERRCRTEYSYGAQYATSHNVLLDNPALQDVIESLRRDPVLARLAAAYLGTLPIYSGGKVWWSYAVNTCPLATPQPVHYFHYDLPDYRCLRFFFYLTDVNLESGPHQVVRGSHRQRRLRDVLAPLKACPDQDMIDYYGGERVITVLGPAGTGFAEDPFVFHKGTPPQSQDRLILMLQYVACEYGVSNPSAPLAFWKSE